MPKVMDIWLWAKVRLPFKPGTFSPTATDWQGCFLVPWYCLLLSTQPDSLGGILCHTNGNSSYLKRFWLAYRPYYKKRFLKHCSQAELSEKYTSARHVKWPSWLRPLPTRLLPSIQGRQQVKVLGVRKWCKTEFWFSYFVTIPKRYYSVCVSFY